MIEANPALKKAVAEAVKRGFTVDAIREMISNMGVELARSSVGAAAQKFRALADQQRQTYAVSEAFAKEFGKGDDHQTRLMLQLMITLITQTLMPAVSAGRQVSTKQLSELASAVNKSTIALKIDDDRMRAIRNDTLKEAAAAAEVEGRAAGASEEQIERIKAKLLGLAT